MPNKHLTDRAIRALKVVEAKQLDTWDSSFRVPGVQFGVRCYRRGLKVFVARYRARDGRRPVVRIGDIGQLSLAEARQKAREIAALAMTTNDPARVRDQYRAAETFAELSEKFAAHIEGKVRSGALRPRTRDEYLRLIRADLLSAWGNRKLVDIARKDVIALIDVLEVERGARVLARRARALIHQMFQFALERDLVAANPGSGLPRQRRLAPRTRVLSPEEIAKVWHALDSFSPNIRGIFRLLILTGQRPTEVSNMRWNELRGGDWYLPGTRAKNGRAHIIPLSAQSQEVLREMKLLSVNESGERQAAEFVFPSRRKGVATSWLNKACRSLVEEAMVSYFTPHDIRRTVATIMRQRKVSREVVAKLLNHTPQSVTEIHYDRYELLAERREALAEWGAYLASLVEAVELKAA